MSSIIEARFPCWTIVRICLKSPQKITIFPQNGLGFSISWRKRSSASVIKFRSHRCFIPNYDFSRVSSVPFMEERRSNTRKCETSTVASIYIWTQLEWIIVKGKSKITMLNRLRASILDEAENSSWKFFEQLFPSMQGLLRLKLTNGPWTMCVETLLKRSSSSYLFEISALLIRLIS